MPEQQTPNVAIELRDVSASSGAYKILTNASISFPQGLCSVIMGAAGSGKSTLLKVAAGLVVPDKGLVLYMDSDTAKFGRKEEFAFRARSGFVFQDAALWSDTNILGNVAMPLRVHKAWMGESAIAEAVRLVLARLGYEEGMAMRPADLSSGEQKVVSIARAIVHDPELVFMDDPMSNLDEDAVEKVYLLIDELRNRGRTVIITANSSELAYRCADRLGVIQAKRVAAFGTYDQTLGSAEEALTGSLARLRARGSRGKADPGGAENTKRGDA